MVGFWFWLGKSGGWSRRLGVERMFIWSIAPRNRNFACFYARANPSKTTLTPVSHHSLVMDRHHRSGRKPDVTRAKSKKTLPMVALGFYPP